MPADGRPSAAKAKGVQIERFRSAIDDYASQWLTAEDI